MVDNYVVNQEDYKNGNMNYLHARIKISKYTVFSITEGLIFILRNLHLVDLNYTNISNVFNVTPSHSGILSSPVFDVFAKIVWLSTTTPQPQQHTKVMPIDYVSAAASAKTATTSKTTNIKIDLSAATLLDTNNLLFYIIDTLHLVDHLQQTQFRRAIYPRNVILSILLDAVRRKPTHTTITNIETMLADREFTKVYAIFAYALCCHPVYGRGFFCELLSSCHNPPATQFVTDNLQDIYNLFEPQNLRIYKHNAISVLLQQHPMSNAMLMNIFNTNVNVFLLRGALNSPDKDTITSRLIISTILHDLTSCRYFFHIRGFDDDSVTIRLSDHNRNIVSNVRLITESSGKKFYTFELPIENMVYDDDDGGGGCGVPKNLMLDVHQHEKNERELCLVKVISIKSPMVFCGRQYIMSRTLPPKIQSFTRFATLQPYNIITKYSKKTLPPDFFVLPNLTNTAVVIIPLNNNLTYMDVCKMWEYVSLKCFYKTILTMGVLLVNDTDAGLRALNVLMLECYFVIKKISEDCVNINGVGCGLDFLNIVDILNSPNV